MLFNNTFKNINVFLIEILSKALKFDAYLLAKD